LNNRKIKNFVIKQEDVAKYEREGKPIVCALNYLSVKPGLEERFEEKLENFAE